MSTFDNRPVPRALSRWLLVALLSVSLPVAPATIEVNGTCTLPDAINAANMDNTSSGLCPPGGSGADTLRLGGLVSLATVADNAFGPTGLPIVTSDITVDGGDFIIERAEGAPNFRIFVVEATGTLTLNDVTLRNGSTEYSGGAIYSYAGRVTLNNSTVSGNQSYGGGGIFSYAGTVTLSNTEITGNHALGDGGGSYHYNGIISITNSTVSGNQSLYSGGGILSTQATDIIISNSTISDNTAIYGGALANYFGSVSITNSTLSGNSALSGGGISTVLGAVGLRNSTLSGNSASLGGGIFTSGGPSVTVTRSIVANGPSGNCGGSFVVDSSFNFADDGSCGGGFVPITPGLDFDATLVDRGGLTLTHGLLRGSIAANPAGECGLEFDQRGYGRNDGACDSGAFEFGAVACSSCAVDNLLVGLLSELRHYQSCRKASCSNPGFLLPLEYICSLAPPPPGDGYYYLD